MSMRLYGNEVGFYPIVQFDESYYVLVSHKELDDLVGSLMQMCELTGDIEQRKALKSEIKERSRCWLDSRYADSGYRNYTLDKAAAVTEIK